MREILFKAKRVDNREWVDGLFCKWRFSGKSLFTPCIQTIKEWDSGDYLDFIEVDPATVCQYTGLLDKNGKMIFEGDIVTRQGYDHDLINTFKEDDPRWEQDLPLKEDMRDEVTMSRFPGYWLKNESFGYEEEDLVNPEDCTVIGSIHDTKEDL